MRTAGIVLLATVLVFTGCSEPAAPDPETLAGTWVATSVEFARVASPPMAVDIVPLGGSLVLTLMADFAFTMDFAFPGESVWPLAGNWHADYDVLTLNYTSGMSGTNQFDMTLSGDRLTLRGADFLAFAFVGDNVEPAKLNLVLEKQ